MKKIYLYLIAFIVIFSVQFSFLTRTFGQCCPFLEIIPSAPSTQDSIYAVVWSSTPNLGACLGYDINDLGSEIRITGCFVDGIATQPSLFIDTLNLGLKPIGAYTVNYCAKIVYYNSNCEAYYADSTSANFSVGYLGLSTLYQPNSVLIGIYDLLGRPCEASPGNVVIYVYSNGSRRKVYVPF